MTLLIAMVSDGIGKNNSIACILQETTSMFATSPVVAAATIAWIELACMVSSHFSQSIPYKASASTLLFPDL